MAISKEVLDELMTDYKGPEDITGSDGILKQLTKALIERAMEAEITNHLGYNKE
jgi:transposase-like protein